MKTLFIIAMALLMPLSITSADDLSRVSIIDSNTPTKALLAKPGTYLGEAFTFEQQQSGDITIKVGVWEAGAGEFHLTNFPFTEYVLMISGVVKVTEKNGTSNTFKAGDTFVIPKGWTGTWDVLERMKKQIVRIGAAK